MVEEKALPCISGEVRMILLYGCVAVERQPKIMMSDERYQVRDSIGAAGGRMGG
jgi:hypothetical protein